MKDKVNNVCVIGARTVSLKPGSHVRSKRKGERNTPRFTREIVKQEQPQEEEKGGGGGALLPRHFKTPVPSIDCA